MYYETGGDVSECEVGSVMKGDQGESGRCMEEEIQEDRSGRGLERREWWARFRTRIGFRSYTSVPAVALTELGLQVGNVNEANLDTWLAMPDLVGFVVFLAKDAWFTWRRRPRLTRPYCSLSRRMCLPLGWR